MVDRPGPHRPLSFPLGRTLLYFLLGVGISVPRRCPIFILTFFMIFYSIYDYWQMRIPITKKEGEVGKKKRTEDGARIVGKMSALVNRVASLKLGKMYIPFAGKDKMIELGPCEKVKPDIESRGAVVDNTSLLRQKLQLVIMGNSLVIRVYKRGIPHTYSCRLL